MTSTEHQDASRIKDSSCDATEATATAYFSISGMHSRACESYLERLATDIEGVSRASSSYTTEVTRVEYDPKRVNRATIEDGLSSWGYRASEPSPEETSADRSDFDFQHFRMIFSVIVISIVYLFYAGFFYPVYLGIFPNAYLDNSLIIVGIYRPLALFTTIIVFGVGFPIHRSAYISLREHRLTADVLVSIASIATYGYSITSLAFLDRQFVFFDVVTTIIVVATLGNYIRARYKRRAVRGLTGRLGADETTVHRLTDTEETETVSPEDCTAGDRFLVRPGEHIPLDGTVIDGTGAVNEALITGEARPQRKAPGDSVIGGSVAIDGAFEIRVGENATSTLDQLRDLVWNLQADRTSAERLTNRVVSVYTLFVCGLTIATFLGWILIGANADSAFTTALTVLVVACPVSLGLVTPLAIGRGLSVASDRGAPVLDQTVLERITDVDIVVFDKTGTLTTGEMRVTDVETIEKDDTEDVLERAAAVEARSSHPIAAAIRTGVSDPPKAADFERYRYGVAATVGDITTAVGNPALFDELGWDRPASVQRTVSKVRERGELPTVIGWDGEAKGVVALADTPRERWETVVEQLGSDDRRTVMITGDDPRVARQFETHPALDEVFADVSPDGKEALVRELQQKGTVAMVGDGTNDAPALTSADLGVAMVSGSDFTITVADALVTDGGLDPFAELFTIARKTRRRLIENLVLAFLVPAIGLPLAVAGVVTPVVAGLLMAVGTALVLANSARPLIASANTA
jgi:Cu2+-exporting ATPase